MLLPSTLTTHEATVTLRMLKQTMQSEGSDTAVIVDAAPLQQLDTSALAVLLELARLARALGREFAVRGVPAKLAALAKLYGVEELILGTGPAQRNPAT